MNIESISRIHAVFDLNKKTAVFLEHYPVYSKEANLLSEYRPDRVCFLNSLDDPILQLFGGKSQADARPGA
jgi:hypothetical protein